jgi:hypothetical protein
MMVTKNGGGELSCGGNWQNYSKFLGDRSVYVTKLWGV